MNHPSSATEMRDHWWWRPGWKLGRSFYTWHVTFADQLSMHTVADAYGPMLETLPMLDPIPIPWLHLTMQGLGFTDEIDRSDADAIVQAVVQRLVQLTPFTVPFGPPEAHPEGVFLLARPADPLRQVRAVIREAIAEVWGREHVPESTDGWRPHVSLAYSNAPGPMGPIADALAAQPARVADVELSAVSLIDLNRDNKSYEWTDIATVEFGR